MVTERAARLVLLLVLALLPRLAHAHEARPGYLALTEQAPGHYQVLWKQPANGDMTLAMRPVFPQGCAMASPARADLLPGALVSRFTLACTPSLAGRGITIAGLDATLTDVLVELHSRDGHVETHLARSIAPTVTLTSTAGGDSSAGRAWIYLSLGLRHIAMGPDHLLFVLGLLLIVRSRRALFGTITAFTVAHSITLALATFGVIDVPAPPLNAAIALSILFLGPEAIRRARGGTSLTLRSPWLVAFAFGLLHGLGFATGLAEMGLPRSEIPIALLLFNLGVELGQIGFVLLVFALIRAFRLMQLRWPTLLSQAPAYCIGILGAFWTLQRLLIIVESIV